MFPDLADKVAIVAGGTGGLGAAQVRRFREAGTRVLVGDLNKEALDALADEIGDGVEVAVLDVTDPASWDSAVERAKTVFGRLDILVCTQGIAPQSDFETMPLDLFMNTVNVNQTGVFLGMRSVIPTMRAAGGGSIINVSSSGAYSPRPRLLAYSASKAAVVAMTKAAALEVGQYGIRVNCICPGAFDTPLRAATAAAWKRNNPEGKTENLFESFPIPRLGRPEELANLTLFLASDMSSYCTGAMFLADGGRLAGTTNYGNKG